MNRIDNENWPVGLTSSSFQGGEFGEVLQKDGCFWVHPIGMMYIAESNWIPWKHQQSARKQGTGISKCEQIRVKKNNKSKILWNLPDWDQQEAHHLEPTSVKTEVLVQGSCALCSSIKRYSLVCNQLFWHKGLSFEIVQFQQNIGSPEREN